MRIPLAGGIVLIASFTWAAAPPERINSDEINELLQKLDDDSFEVRQRADERLRSIGKAVVPTLKVAVTKTKSLEVKARVRRIIHDLTIDERISEMVRQLGDSSTRERVCWVLRRAGENVILHLEREIKEDMSSEQRKQLEQLIAELKNR